MSTSTEGQAAKLNHPEKFSFEKVRKKSSLLCFIFETETETEMFLIL